MTNRSKNIMSTKEIGFHPGARLTDPDTSHEALDDRDHSETQLRIMQDVEDNGPGTEAMILNRMGIERTSASSQISALVDGGYLENLIDPRTKKVIRLRNPGGSWAQVRGLPKHQRDTKLIGELLVRMDKERERGSRKPPLSTLGAEKSNTSGVERRRGERRKGDRRKPHLGLHESAPYPSHKDES